MKLIVPDIIIPSAGEKTLRQYKCANISSSLGKMNADMTIAVTNKRLIQHAETKGSKKSELIHNEILIDEIGGFSFFRGKQRDKRSLNITLVILFILFAAGAGIVFWQSAPIFTFIKQHMPNIAYDTVFKIVITAIPIVIYIIIAIIISSVSWKYLFNMVIYTKGLNNNNIFSESKELLDANNNYIYIPYLKETQAMILEIGSLILDVKKYGPDEVLKHIDVEESTE